MSQTFSSPLFPNVLPCSHCTVNTLRLPPKNAKIYKEECTYCFENWDSEAGIYVCLACWNGGCFEHAKNHATKCEHPIACKIRRVPKEKPDMELEAVERPQKLTKLAVGVEGGAPLNENPKDFTYTTEPWCFRCNQKLDARSLELLGAMGAVVQCDSASRVEDTKAWENQVIQCEHTVMLVQEPNAPKLASKALSSCGECELSSNLWLCLTCGHLGCGRKAWDGSGGNGHGLEHYDKTGHAVVCKLGTITPEGTADIHCYKCDEMRLDPNLADHLNHFGINIATQTKTEKSLAEMELELNQNIDSLLSKVTEGGKQMKNVYGPGYTGLRNLGNTCYMASIVQVLFALPEFPDRYFSTVHSHQSSCRNAPQDCYQCQMTKLADGLLSGRYSNPPEKREGSKAEQEEDEQPGIPPRMFRSLICRDHAEFSSMRQQDAYEFFQFLLKTIQQRERTTGMDPSQTFFFNLQQKLQCTRCKRVRYSSVKQSEVSLVIPLDQADPPVQPIEGEKPDERYKREAKSTVKFQACVDSLIADEVLEDFQCPNCNAKTTALKHYRFETFPNTLMIQMRRFVYEDWVPRKLSVQVDVPDVIDLGSTRAVQPPADEVKFTENIGGGAKPVETPQAKEEDLQILMSMGFPRIRCERALIATSNNGPEVAMNWLMEHMDDPDIDKPLEQPKSAASSGPAVSEDLIQQLSDMGFTTKQARKALRETSGNMERAVEWLFNHSDDPGEDEAPASQQAQAMNIDEKPAKYELIAFIVHLGGSVHSGHYVAFIKKEGKWIQYNDRKVAESTTPPKEHAYMYFFRRLN